MRTHDTLNYIKEKYNLSFDVQMPIKLAPFHRFFQLVDLFRELGFKKGAEIGTEKGQYAEILCQGIPNLKLFCIDPWKVYKDFQDSWGQDQGLWDTLFEKTKRKLSRYNCELIRKTSMEAVKDFKPNSLDFVFIDGNHDFEYVINDIIQWMKIVRPGGILSGHDFTTNIVRGIPFHVPYAVQAYADAYKISPWFVLHHPGTVDCWMWVKKD
jgi:hypothetical protein